MNNDRAERGVPGAPVALHVVASTASLPTSFTRSPALKPVVPPFKRTRRCDAIRVYVTVLPLSALAQWFALGDVDHERRTGSGHPTRSQKCKPRDVAWR